MTDIKALRDLLAESQQTERPLSQFLAERELGYAIDEALPALLDRLEAQERRVADLRSATQDLVLNVTEAMQTGGWVPTPLHESFFDALTAAYKALEDSNG